MSIITKPEQQLREVLVEVLETIEAVLEDTAQCREEIEVRIATIRRGLDAGLPLRETVPVVTNGQRSNATLPLATVIDHLISHWAQAAVELRRVEIEVLRREGMTMDEIAQGFGITRQRVSQIIQQGKP